MTDQSTPASPPDDLDTLEKNLRAAVGISNVPGKPAQKTVSQAAATADAGISEDDIPVKLRGKPLNEVYRMYRDLESDRGRLANDLGVQRQISDRLINLKRGDDLQHYTPPAQAAQIRTAAASPDELLQDPSGTVDKIVGPRLDQVREDLNKRLASLEVSLAQGRLLAKHPDYLEYPQNQEFVDWVKESQLRQRVAALAAQGDTQAIDDLLTEYKSRAKPAQDDNLEAARNAGLEGTSSQKSASGGRVYSRAALMKLRIEKPDTYADPAFQAEITRAYAEGRVK